MRNLLHETMKEKCAITQKLCFEVPSILLGQIYNALTIVTRTLKMYLYLDHDLAIQRLVRFLYRVGIATQRQSTAD